MARKLYGTANERRHLTELEKLVPPEELKAFLMRQQQNEDDRWERLASAYFHNNLNLKPISFPTMAIKCGLSYGEIAMAWIREQHMNAIMHSAKSVPEVLEDIKDDSLNMEVVCPKCDGERRVFKNGEEVNCPKCQGKGMILRHGDKDARQQFLEVNKLIGQKGGTTVNVPITNLPASTPSLAQVMEEARKVLNGNQPQLAEAVDGDSRDQR